MKNLIVGLLAHVDAGKTTLSEALLYESGKLKKIGRVDNKDAFLDTDEMERERGITIFSKQAAISFEEMQITLMDTPGHVDFSAEMERTLQVLDYAILIISAADGVQAHTAVGFMQDLALHGYSAAFSSTVSAASSMTSASASTARCSLTTIGRTNAHLPF